MNLSMEELLLDSVENSANESKSSQVQHLRSRHLEELEVEFPTHVTSQMKRHNLRGMHTSLNYDQQHITRLIRGGGGILMNHSTTP